MTPQEALTQLDVSLQQTARLKRRLQRLSRRHLPTLYWDLSFDCLRLADALESTILQDKTRLQEMLQQEK